MAQPVCPGPIQRRQDLTWCQPSRIETRCRASSENFQTAKGTWSTSNIVGVSQVVCTDHHHEPDTHPGGALNDVHERPDTHNPSAEGLVLSLD